MKHFEESTIEDVCTGLREAGRMQESSVERVGQWLRTRPRQELEEVWILSQVRIEHVDDQPERAAISTSTRLVMADGREAVEQAVTLHNCEPELSLWELATRAQKLRQETTVH